MDKRFEAILERMREAKAEALVDKRGDDMMTEVLEETVYLLGSESKDPDLQAFVQELMRIYNS